jgi:hypothetical protein
MTYLIRASPARVIRDNPKNLFHDVDCGTQRRRWDPPKDHHQIQKHAHQRLKSLYKRSRARTFTAMLNRSSDSRCSRAARPCAIETGRSSRLRHFRRERTRRRLEGCNQIDGGLVRLSHFSVVDFLRCVCGTCSCLAHFLFVFCFVFDR